MSHIQSDYYKYTNRRIGKTKTMIHLCKRIDAILICSTAQEATEIASVHNIQTFSIHGVINGGLRGVVRPTIYDTDSLMVHIDSLEAENKKLKDHIPRIEDQNKRLKLAIKEADPVELHRLKLAFERSDALMEDEG